MVPLLRFTNDTRIMAGFSNADWVRLTASCAIALITALNLCLAVTTIAGGEKIAPVLIVGTGLMAAVLLGLLGWISLSPLRVRENLEVRLGTN